MPAFVEEFYQSFCNKDVNEQTEWFVQKLWELYDQHCPKQTKTISYKKYIKPWITDDLIQLINDKHKLF